MLYINIGIVKRNQHSEIVQNVNSYSINRMKKRRYRTGAGILNNGQSVSIDLKGQYLHFL
jgi:hypothetical protein